MSSISSPRPGFDAGLDSGAASSAELALLPIGWPGGESTGASSWLKGLTTGSGFRKGLGPWPSVSVIGALLKGLTTGSAFRKDCLARDVPSVLGATSLGLQSNIDASVVQGCLIPSVRSTSLA